MIYAMFSLYVPVVHVGRMGFDTAEVQNLVFPDQVAMGVAAARHLAGLGHRRFMAVHSQKRFGFELDRLKGFENYLIGKGGVRPRICVGGCAKESGDWKPVGAGAFAEWAAISPDSRPTAVFCVNDGTAAGFILAARAAGVRVPEDVSVMGVDNFHSLFYPQGIDLTTLDQNFDGVAAEAIALLVALMSGTRRHASIIKIEPRLIVRSTTARIE